MEVMGQNAFTPMRGAFALPLCHSSSVPSMSARKEAVRAYSLNRLIIFKQQNK